MPRGSVLNESQRFFRRAPPAECLSRGHRLRRGRVAHHPGRCPDLSVPRDPELVRAAGDRSPRARFPDRDDPRLGLRTDARGNQARGRSGTARIDKAPDGAKAELVDHRRPDLRRGISRLPAFPAEPVLVGRARKKHRGVAFRQPERQQRERVFCRRHPGRHPHEPGADPRKTTCLRSRRRSGW
jgi:hypothetical protein